MSHGGGINIAAPFSWASTSCDRLIDQAESPVGRLSSLLIMTRSEVDITANTKRNAIVMYMVLEWDCVWTLIRRRSDRRAVSGPYKYSDSFPTAATRDKQAASGQH